MVSSSDLAAGASNLLVNCACLQPDQRVLVLHEDPALGWYDLAAPTAVADCARSLGNQATMVAVGGPDQVLPHAASEAIAAHDVIVFFARAGDQGRFEERDDGKVSVMSYARTADALGSSYGRTDHRAFLALKEAVDAILREASKIEVRCPLGSHIIGHPTPEALATVSDVSMRRFPMGVPTPVSMASFSGQVVLARYLTPTGNKVYEPASLAIGEPVTVKVDGNRMIGLSGAPDDVSAVRQHYEAVSDRLGIEPYFVHSFHAGLHTGCEYRADAADDPDRWSNNIFNSPRFLHFHTCGAYPPGEICWMLQDPTLAVNDQALWQDGALALDMIAQKSDVFTDWPELPALLARRPELIGVAA
jgi:hypothetical protein